MLGAGNEGAARAALGAFPDGMHIGGGVNAQNARNWLEAGASHVIVTSWVFREGRVDWERLGELVKAIGKEHLVLDLSCRNAGKITSSSPIAGRNYRADGQRGNAPEVFQLLRGISDPRRRCGRTLPGH